MENCKECNNNKKLKTTIDRLASIFLMVLGWCLGVANIATGVAIYNTNVIGDLTHLLAGASMIGGLAIIAIYTSFTEQEIRKLDKKK